MHVLVEVPLGDAELITDQLWTRGAVGVEERPSSIVGAFEDAGLAEAAAVRLGGTAVSVADDTGLDAWRDHAQVFEAGPFSIRPPWLDPGPGIDLVIDPAHTFGSGSHPSTRLALELLAELVTPAMTVLDLGAGSGILAIAAAQLGAKVTAIELDPSAADTIPANAAANGVADRVAVLIADIAALAAPRPAPDLVLLNVTIDIHEHVAAGPQTQIDAPMVVAGILAGEQEARVAAAHRRTISQRRTHDEWAALVLDHGPGGGRS